VEKVLRDVREGFVSIEKATEDYGVVIDPLTYQVNDEETQKGRGQWGSSSR
jgi:N-methylhydantoinase B